jgi:hypothetical protein
MVIGIDFFKLNIEPASASEFVSNWSKFYNEGKYSDKEYEKSLNRKGLLRPQDIQFLLEWKNGKPLSKPKQAIANNVKRQISKMNEFRGLPKVTNRDFSELWSFVSSIINYGIVWKVFLVHISRPDEYPIVDQHVLRAWKFLTENRIIEPDQTLENYSKYKDFFFSLAQQSQEGLRSVDQALMTFGQFLNSQFSAVARASMWVK